uniref:DUF3615 domain-containing protein n=1 Tax=Leersia perrieri TaxID=77586 RepID=A0A0D9VH63_9ORYZ
MDRGGCFHVYPGVGGEPYKSLAEVDVAIDQHLHGLRIPEMGDEELNKLSEMDRAIQLALFWPDGTRRRSNGGYYEKDKCNLIQALLDKYNDDHYLVEDVAYELKEFLQFGTIYEDNMWYYHLNFTTKIKGADCGVDNLFFAEISHMQGVCEWAVSCCCMLKPDDNGRCYGCRNDGCHGMKHPNNPDAYTPGCLNGYLPFGGGPLGCEFDPNLSLEDEEAMLRHKFKGLEKPFVIVEPPYASLMLVEK